MKVVLFCGGVGARLKEYSETVPKPMVPIGHRPIIWHLMKYYAHYGHNEFILCLGYRGDAMRRFFLSYDECESNDFTLADGGKRVHLYSRDISDWSITFVDTGLESAIGERLRRVRLRVFDLGLGRRPRFLRSRHYETNARFFVSCSSRSFSTLESAFSTASCTICSTVVAEPFRAS